MHWQAIHTRPIFQCIYGYSLDGGIEIISFIGDDSYIDDFGLVSSRKFTHWKYLTKPTQDDMASMPTDVRVFAYCPEYHRGPGKEKQGIMQVWLDSKTGQLKDMCNGEVLWKFTHWDYVEPPYENNQFSYEKK